MSVLKTRFAAQAARTLRQNMTDAELKLWSKLRNRQLSGHKFVRQQPVGRFIADFADHLNKAPSPGLRFAKPDLSPKGRGEDGPN